MAVLLAVLTSGRRHGFTAGLLDCAVEGAGKVPGVQVDFVHTHAFCFGPCTSCFACIRDEHHVCVLDDDLGKEGRGDLFRRIAEANGLLIADPVHNWSPSASARLLIERCYPFLWSGKLNGMPAGTISCASNQGMQLLAQRELCKWLFGFRLRYQGGVAAHVAAYEDAQVEARALGQRVAQAAVADATQGRQPQDDEACFAAYATGASWSPLEAYLENLMPAGDQQPSVMARALAQGSFRRPEAIRKLELAQQELVQALSLHGQGQVAEAARSLARASAYWTRATWEEFLEEDVIGVAQPDAYRPLPRQT